MENLDLNSAQPDDTIYFEFADPGNLKVQHVDGAFGTMTERGLIMILFSEMVDFTQDKLVHVNGKPVPSDNKERTVIRRDVQFAGALSWPRVELIRNWLDERLKQHKQFQEKQDEQE